MKALLIGASGLIGRQILNKLLEDNFYSEVEIRVRKSLGIKHTKLKETLTDFSEINSLKEIDANHVFCCLGTTIKKAKSKEQFRKVDFEYVVNLAKSAEESNTSKFLVISSIGANYKSGNFYLRTKGEMEEALKKINIPTINIFRPSLLVGKRTEYRFGEVMGKFFMGIFGIFLFGRFKKYRSIKDFVVANAMIRLAKSEKTGISIFESDQIQELGQE
jgi:uncharacterized protein YbjT (DUF2867 family)